MKQFLEVTICKIFEDQPGQINGEPATITTTINGVDVEQPDPNAEGYRINITDIPGTFVIDLLLVSSFQCYYNRQTQQFENKVLEVTTIGAVPIYIRMNKNTFKNHLLATNSSGGTNIPNLPSFADRNAALAGGLSAGDLFKTDGTGVTPLDVPNIVCIV